MLRADKSKSIAFWGEKGIECLHTKAGDAQDKSSGLGEGMGRELKRISRGDTLLVWTVLISW